MSKRIVDFFNTTRSFYCILKARAITILLYTVYTNTTPQKHGKTVSSTFVSTKVYELYTYIVFRNLIDWSSRKIQFCLNAKLYTLPFSCKGLQLETHAFLAPINIKNMENLITYVIRKGYKVIRGKRFLFLLYRRKCTNLHSSVVSEEVILSRDFLLDPSLISFPFLI
jgi:hypothetical protein